MMSSGAVRLSMPPTLSPALLSENPSSRRTIVKLTCGPACAVGEPHRGRSRFKAYRAVNEDDGTAAEGPPLTADVQSKPKTPLESTRLTQKAFIYLILSRLNPESRQLTDKYWTYSIFARPLCQIVTLGETMWLRVPFGGCRIVNRAGPQKKITSKMKEQPTMLLKTKDEIF
jgi:hypothetical protein